MATEAVLRSMLTDYLCGSLNQNDFYTWFDNATWETDFTHPSPFALLILEVRLAYEQLNAGGLQMKDFENRLWSLLRR